MTAEQTPTEQKALKSKEEELPLPWQRIQGAIWLLGIAILALFDWWWPGILVLAAISGLVQGGLQLYLSRKAEEKQLTERRAEWLPSLCPSCGGPLSVTTVTWTGPNTADCPYCKANLKPAV
jgi:prepilin signal peptidase PulO-like enzyme (type II secretory pathway)